MSAYLRYLHHLYVDPLSAKDQAEAAVLVVLPSLLVVCVLMGVWQWFWEKYND